MVTIIQGYRRWISKLHALLFVVVVLFIFYDSVNAQVRLGLPPTRDHELRGVRYKGMVFIPYLGIEGGYNSNLFRLASEDKEGIVGAGVLGVTPGLELSNETPNVVKLKWEAWGTVYKYFSDSEEAKNQGLFAASSCLRAEFLPKSVIGFFVDDRFSRQVVPPNYPGVNSYDRNVNRAEIGVQIRPGGGALVFAPSYAFNFALYDSQTEIDVWSHEARVLTTWDVLPKTMVFLDIDWHAKDWRKNIANIREDLKPLNIMVGMKGFVTRKMAVTAAGGFAKTFFKRGPEYTGFIADLAVGLKPTGYFFLDAGYKRTVEEGVWGNYVATDWASFRTGLQILRRVNLLASFEYGYQRYGSVQASELTSEPDVTYSANQSDRRDHVLQGSASVSWSIMRHIIVEASYSFSGRMTDFYLERTFKSETIRDYARFKQHIVFAGVKAIY